VSYAFSRRTHICKGKITLLMKKSRKPTGSMKVKFHAFHFSHLIGLTGSLLSPISSILRDKVRFGFETDV
jgi:hypothetical protein